MSKLQEAAKLANEDWIATLPDEFPEPEYSANHLKRMKKLINKMRGDHYHYLTTKTVKILVVAAILTVLLLTAFVFPSSRDSIIQTFGIDSLHTMTEGNKNSVSKQIDIGYIPNGFELVETNILNKVAWNLYTSKDSENFVVYKFTSTNITFFDTEQYDYESITYNGKEFRMYQNSNADFGIIWTQYDYVYEINGTISLDELLKIAESVK